jgi:hypothetical protein
MIGFIDTAITITLNYNQLYHLTINNCLGPAPFHTGLRVVSLLLWLTWFWFTTRSLLLHEWIRRTNHLRMNTLSQSQSYITTDGQSASLSCNKAPIWGLRPNLYYCMTVAGLLIWALSLTGGWVCRLQLLLAFASAVTLGSESLGTRDHILLSQIRDFPGALSLSLNLILRPTVSRPVCLEIKHPSGADEEIFVTVIQLRVCWHGAVSLTRGRICRLQLQLALASAVIFGFESVGTCDHNLPYNFGNISHHLQQFLYHCLPIRSCGSVPSDPLPSNGFLSIVESVISGTHLPSRCLAMVICVTIF